MPVDSDMPYFRNPRDFDQNCVRCQLAQEQYVTVRQVLSAQEMTADDGRLRLPKIDEKMTVFQLGWTMHQFLMCRKNPRAPKDQREHLKRGSNH